MIRYTLTVPGCFNNGKRVPFEWTEKLETDLAGLFGGFTRLSGHGGWVSPDCNLVSEPVFIYQVDSDDPFAPTLLDGFARRVKSDLEQECVYLTSADISVTLI